MINRYRPKDIRAISGPITANNTRNANNHPAIHLGNCTVSQLFNNMRIGNQYTTCIIGNPSRGIGVAKTLIRQSTKPFLFIGPKSDETSQFNALQPDWTMNSLQNIYPAGNGAIFLSRPTASYLELCEYFEDWCHDYLLILHLSRGFQIGPELLNLLGAAEQCVIFSDSIPLSLRSNESRALTTKEFLSQMSHLFVFSAGAETKDLIDILPTYQYERVSNSMNLNSFRSRSIFHPFRSHVGNGLSWGQTRTMEYKKSIFEMDELKRIFDDGTALLYDVKTNEVFLAQII